MIVRNKFDPETEKVVFRAFAFNGVKFKVGDDFIAKKANSSPRQLKALYNARRIKDKLEGVSKPSIKPHKLSREEEFAKAVAEKEAEDHGRLVVKLGQTKASILQAVANKEAEEAYDAQVKADNAKDKTKKKPAKKKAETKKPADEKTAPWE